jgi:hypothetical protein
MSASPEIPVNAEAVTWAYRLILGREPESEEVIAHHVRSHASVSEMRQRFISSAEFKSEQAGQAYGARDDVKQLTQLIEGTKHHSLGHYVRATEPDREKTGRAFHHDENCNFWPNLSDFAGDDFIERYVLKGWMPVSRQISSKTKVTTFGSCFAVSIAKHLSKVGYSISKDRDPEIYISRMSEGLVNIHAITQQFEWALEGKTPPKNLWYGYKAEEYGYRPEIRERTRTVMLDTDFFIITLGLSEVWYDEPTGGVLWRGVPLEVYDPARHKFRMCSVEETKRKISAIYDMIGTHVPRAKVLFTLSPIPLMATFRPVGCVTANAASKAILRSALDEFYRDNSSDLNRKLFYFPSYEIACELFPNRFEHDFRHPRSAIVEFIMQTFEAVYCESGMSMREINRKFHDTRLANRQVVAAGTN